MSRSRLTTALAEAGLTLPEGRILVLHPPADRDLSALPKDRTLIVSTFRPDHDAWAAQGWEVATAGGPADLALVIVPRSRAFGALLLAEAARLAPVVVVDGQRGDGVDGLWRDLRRRFGDMPTVTQGHGRLFWLTRPDPAELPPPPRRAIAGGWTTVPGIFSEDGPDRGSVLLAAALPATLPARMADLGAGWGYLSRAVLDRAGVVSLDLVEAEARALDCARINVSDPRARFHWEDATAFRGEAPFDGIVMNPPFHQGRAADPGIGQAFVAAAARLLGREGRLWMVANRHLPYEAALRAVFRDVTEIGGDPAFKLFHAARPLGRGRT